MSRFKTENKSLDYEKEEYMKLVHILTKYGYLHVKAKNEMIELEQLRDLVPVIEDYRKKYGVNNY